jgi:hypothetical protein
MLIGARKGQYLGYWGIFEVILIGLKTDSCLDGRAGVPEGCLAVDMDWVTPIG